MKKLYICTLSIILFASVDSLEHSKALQCGNHILNGSLFAALSHLTWIGISASTFHADNISIVGEEVNSLRKIFVPTGVSLGIVGSVISYIYENKKKSSSFSQKDKSLKLHVISSYGAALATVAIRQMICEQKLQYTMPEALYYTFLNAGLYSGALYGVKALINEFNE